MSRNKFPYSFILDYLSHIDIIIKPMFGCFGVYYRDIIYLFVQKRGTVISKENGVSIAVRKEYVKEMKSLFPAGEADCSESSKNPWLFVSESSPEFENYCLKFCELLIKRDKRVGRIKK